MESICGHLREVHSSMLTRAGEDYHGKKFNEFLAILERFGYFFVHTVTSKLVAVLAKIKNPVLDFVIL